MDRRLKRLKNTKTKEERRMKFLYGLLMFLIVLALCECSNAAGGWRRRDVNDEEIHNVAVWALHEKYPNLGNKVDFTVKQAMSQVRLSQLCCF
jgi:hypothetical protein